MKTKPLIYFLLAIVGVIIMGFGDNFIQKEYALSIGMVFLMLGIYKSSQTWSGQNTEEETTHSNEEEL